MSRHGITNGTDSLSNVTILGISTVVLFVAVKDRKAKWVFSPRWPWGTSGCHYGSTASTGTLWSPRGRQCILPGLDDFARK